MLAKSPRSFLNSTVDRGFIEPRSTSAPNSQLPLCKLYPICPPPKTLLRWRPCSVELSDGVSSVRTNLLSFQAPPICAPMYQPVQLYTGGAYGAAFNGMSAACAAPVSNRPANKVVPSICFFMVQPLV